MSSTNLSAGARINHPKYGEGVIFGSDMSFYKVFFREHGDKEIARDFDGIEVVNDGPENDNVLTMEVIEEALSGVLQRYADFTVIIPMGDRWRGGNLVLEPGNDSASKEIPIETFFRKIVMVRDRLRVLEQNINSHPKLDDEDRVHLQQYITRIYGSLTTFNILFARKEDHFVGDSSKEK